MAYTEQRSEMMEPLVVLNPVSLGVGVNTSASADMSGYHRAWLVVNVGAIGQAGTIDVALWEATSAAGAGAQYLKGITQLTQAGGDGDELVCIELQTEEMDVDGGYEYLAVIVTIGTSASLISYILYGCEPRYPPVPTTGWGEIVE